MFPLLLQSFQLISLVNLSWGSAIFLRLTVEPAKDLKAGISIEQLPKTFHEAVSVAKWFSVPYIWIDSLCIMQDSLDDWNCEASLMSLVYQNSLCNIAATGALDSTEGLFFDRDPDSVQLCKSSYRVWRSPPNSPRVAYVHSE